MKRIILTAAVALMAALSANAQIGIVGGLTTTATNLNDAYKDVAQTKTVSQYHVGLVYNVNLPLGFSVQPGVLYNVKGQTLNTTLEKYGMGNYDITVDSKTGYLEVPVRVAWGVDFGIVEPFVFAEPFVGYALTTEAVSQFKDSATKELANAAVTALGGKLDTSNSDSDKWVDRNRVNYGIGLGAGVKVLNHAAISVKYYWDLGAMYKEAEDGSDKVSISASAVGTAVKNQKCSGIAATLTLYF